MKANLQTWTAAVFCALFLSAEPCLTFTNPLIRLRGVTDMMELLFRRRDHISPRVKLAFSTGIPAHVSYSHRHARAMRRELSQRGTKNYFASIASCAKCIVNAFREGPVQRKRKNLQRLPARFSRWVSTKLRQRRLSCKVHCKAFRHLQAMQIWMLLTFALLSVFRLKSKSCISAVEARNRVCRAYSLDSVGPPRRRLAADGVGVYPGGESEGEQSSEDRDPSVGRMSCSSRSSSISGSSSAGYVTAGSSLSLSSSSFYSVEDTGSPLRSGDGISIESSFPPSSGRLDGHGNSPRCSLCLESAVGARGDLNEVGDDGFPGVLLTPHSLQHLQPPPASTDIHITGGGGGAEQPPAYDDVVRFPHDAESSRITSFPRSLSLNATSSSASGDYLLDENLSPKEKCATAVMLSSILCSIFLGLCILWLIVRD